MRVIPEIEAYKKDLITWRRDIHAHPELAYQEERTANLVAERLESWGIPVSRGLAKTGVVGTLARGYGPRVGLRADMDALAMEEANTFAHRSRHAGRMHACGHDGHTAMLLGAARYLAEHGDFSGTVQVIFQPAEEAAGGARVMLEDGLFERFPVDAVFGMHNWPGLPVGQFSMRTGPMMASLDCFDIRVVGKGTHGALPHHGVDPIMVSAQLVSALQTIVSRGVDPLQAAAISVTKIRGGDSHNIIPAAVELSGGIRCFDSELREFLRQRLVEVVDGVCASFGAAGEVAFVASFPAVVNAAEATELAARTAAELVGAENVTADAEPIMASEDFAYMLEAKPGCYSFIGHGAGDGACMVHNPNYDFNDEALTLGATYWVTLARNFLREQAG